MHERLKERHKQGARIQFWNGYRWEYIQYPTWCRNTEYREEPGKYDELKKRWESGARIQFYSPTAKKWLYIETPAWAEDIAYREEPFYISLHTSKGEPMDEVTRQILRDGFEQKASQKVREAATTLHAALSNGNIDTQIDRAVEQLAEAKELAARARMFI